MSIELAAANSGTSYTITAPTHGEKRLRLTLTGNATLTLSGGTAGEVCAVNLLLIQDATASRTVTWPGNISWGPGGNPTLSTAATKIDQFYLTTDNGGTTWQGFLIGFGYTLPAVPSAPTSLAGSVTSGDVTLTWTQGAANRSAVFQNKIYRRVTAGSYALLNTISANTTYTDTTPLTDGTSYDYKVSAVNAVGEGAQSNEYTVVPGQVIIASDDFNRADDTATGPTNGLIGDVTPVGSKTWLNHLGAGTWSVTSNKADPTTGAFSIAVIDSGVSDCSVAVDIAVSGSATNEAVRFRCVDANNMCAVVLDPSGLILQKTIAGVNTNVATLGGAIGSGFTGRIKVKMSGSTISVYKDGVQQGANQTISDAAVLTATKHGFASGSATTMTFDNFEVTVP